MALALFSTFIYHTAEAGLPRTITAYYGPSETYNQNVIFVDENDDLVEMGYNGTDGWQLKTLFEQSNGMDEYSFEPSSYVPGSPIVAYEDSYGNGRVFYLTLGIGGEGGFYGIATELRGTSGGVPTTSYELTTELNLNPLNGTLTGDEYLDNDGYYMPGWHGSMMVGFQDSADTPTHHLFYVDYTGTYELTEVYASSSDDSGWYPHTITGENTAYLNNAVGLWDGIVEHVFDWYPSPGGLQETYYSGGTWYNHTLNYESSTAGPPLTAFPAGTGNEYVSGSFQEWFGSSYSFESDYEFTGFDTGSGWDAIDESMTNFSSSVSAAGVQWEDSTDTGYLPTGRDGGFFYVGTNGHLYLYAIGRGAPFDLSGSGEPCSTNGPQFNGVGALWDGSYLHGYCVGQDGDVYEAYAEGSSITTSSNGSWTYHDICPEGGCHAAF